MARVLVSADLSTWITERIEEFPGNHEAHKWLADRVHEMDALPLVLDMGGSYAIRASGDLIQFGWDGPEGAESLEDPRLINAALYQGSLKYPKLASPVSPGRCARLLTLRWDRKTSALDAAGARKLNLLLRRCRLAPVSALVTQ
jgi:hypothetical protein